MVQANSWSRQNGSAHIPINARLQQYVCRAAIFATALALFAFAWAWMSGRT